MPQPRPRYENMHGHLAAFIHTRFTRVSIAITPIEIKELPKLV